MAVVLGFNGEIGSGKSAASERLHAIVGPAKGSHLEFSNAVLAVGDAWMQRLGLVEVAQDKEIDALRSAVADTFGISITPEQAARLNRVELDAYLATRAAMDAAERPVTVANKAIHRPLLQWLGYQMLTHVNPAFWAQTLEAQVRAERDSKELVTVGGVRHPADFDAIHHLEGYVVEVVRPDVTSDLQGHPSEGGVRPGDIDVRVLNNGGLDLLEEKMATLWSDIGQQRLAAVY